MVSVGSVVCFGCVCVSVRIERGMGLTECFA